MTSDSWPATVFNIYCAHTNVHLAVRFFALAARHWLPLGAHDSDRRRPCGRRAAPGREREHGYDQEQKDDLMNGLYCIESSMMLLKVGWSRGLGLSQPGRARGSDHALILRGREPSSMSCAVGSAVQFLNTLAPDRPDVGARGLVQSGGCCRG